MKKILIPLFLIFSLFSFSSDSDASADTAIKAIPQEVILKQLTPLLKKATTYEKYKIVYARQAIKGEEISTYTSDGLETKNTAAERDYIVKNTTDTQEMYILTKEKFDSRYTYSKKLDNTWSVYNPIGEIKAIKVDNALLKLVKADGDEFYIVPAWGGEMVVKKDDYLVSPLKYNEVYRIAEKEFFETYQLKK